MPLLDLPVGPHSSAATRITICHYRHEWLRPSLYTTPKPLDQRESARTGIGIACVAGSREDPAHNSHVPLKIDLWNCDCNDVSCKKIKVVHLIQLCLKIMIIQVFINMLVQQP
jgi:hypothetical protein